MDIAFGDKKLEKTFNSEKELTKRYGQPMAKVIARRMAVLRNAKTLSLVPVTKPERRHPLDGDWAGHYAVDLVQPFRLIFAPNHNPVPAKEDGAPDLEKITAIKIAAVVDYH